MNFAISILLNITLLFHTPFTSNKAVLNNKTDTDKDTTSRKVKTKTLVFPVPVVPSKLFYVQRDPNTNTIIYDLNVDRKPGSCLLDKI